METSPNSKAANNFIDLTSKNAAANANVSGVSEEIKAQPKKPRRRDKSDLGENFIAPDGGVWAWLVCMAAGVSNLSIYPCLQQFGFIYRQRLLDLGLSTSEMTTIINTNPAVSSCTGLLNGPMFRRFSYRQVAMFGSLLIFLGIALSAFCKTFFGYMICYSLLYGFGMGISVSASALAINTYFRKNRRRATGFSWTITGLGPIFLPHIVTFFLSIYNVQETVLILAAFSLHSFVSAMIYQPAQLHIRKSIENGLANAPTIEITPEAQQYMCKFCELQENKEPGIFTSQYLYQEDDEDMCGYEIIEPATPMLSRANDGWFGSKTSLSSHGSSSRFRRVSWSKDFQNDLTVHLNKVSEEDLPADEFLKPNNFKRQAIRRSSSRAQFGREDSTNLFHCTCAEERALIELQSTIVEESNQNNDLELETVAKKITFLQKVIIFFDLDLLRDFTYVNLVAGLTTINFGELNFSILTPFILVDYEFTSHQITTATSVLALMDLTMRFLVPFLTEKISWDNRVFFLIGVLGIAFGRTVVACTRSYYVVLVSFFFIGIFKGIRTIFWPLIIPSYVPLKRLPAASGLQLLITGLFTLAAGPLVGMVRDHFNYSVTIHCLNFMTFFAAVSWTAEVFIRRCLKSRSRKE